MQRHWRTLELEESRRDGREEQQELHYSDGLVKNAQLKRDACRAPNLGAVRGNVQETIWMSD